MKAIIYKNRLGIIGFFLGAVGGYLYYYFYGCNGSCTIKSSPVNMTMYGAVMGFLLLSLFQRDKKTIEKKEEL